MRVTHGLYIIDRSLDVKGWVVVTEELGSWSLGLCWQLFHLRVFAV